MRLAIRLLGLDLLTIELDTETGGDSGAGDATATPLGFTGFATDTRWQPGGEP